MEDWEARRDDRRAADIALQWPGELDDPLQVQVIAACMGYDYDAVEQYLIAQEFDPEGADIFMRRTVHEHVTGGGQ